MRKFIQIINKINEIAMWIVGFMLLIMGILLFYAVIMRYFFNNSPSWSFDLTGLLTGYAAFLGGGYALLQGAHVRVDIFYEKFSLRTQSLSNIISSTLLFLLVIVLVWKGMEEVLTNYQNNTIASTGLNIPVWIKWVMLPLGGVLLGIQAIAHLIQDFYVVIKGKRMFD
ncbi:TRAP transporter small permease subunit [Oceanobacillus salinisoli]|uniref:TRAP transporter small permease subunit n=1 Tax=Oceanobacillus salinisoli TaxID=2678611 RepID=UPI0012E11889|nr:TRAP transporter small permease [Oceanobacillus salinisoli]